MSLLQWIVAKQSGLLSIAMLKVILIFAALCFHMFDKMTISRIKNIYINIYIYIYIYNVYVEKQIGRTNIEEYYYVSKLHSLRNFSKHWKIPKVFSMDFCSNEGIKKNIRKL